MRGALENLLAFLLCHTPQNTETLALFLQFLVVRQAVEDFLLGFIANGTGVVENQPGFFDRENLAVSLGQKCANYLLRIVHIHLAAKDFQIEGFWCVSRHRHLSITPCGRERPARAPDGQLPRRGETGKPQQIPHSLPLPAEPPFILREYNSPFSSLHRRPQLFHN